MVLASGFLTPLSASSESSVDLGLIHVSIQIGSAQRPSSASFANQNSGDLAIGTLSFRAASQNPQLPDSLHFAGLAGALNLAIDRSNGTPLVQGIELAPREILSIGANDSGALRGLHGQISIRLDF